MPRSPHRPPSYPRAALTLFEVAVALAVLAIAVLATALLFPAGLRAEQMARFRLYAAAEMVQLADLCASPEHRFHESQYEAEHLGQAVSTITTTDLERGQQSAFCNVMPLLPMPDEIAARIDSDGDEIAHVLADGGKLFYINPRAVMSMDKHINGYSGGALTGWRSDDLHLAPEQRKLVVAVVGYAQQDALRCHPCLGWPYHEFQPSPPTATHDGAVRPECDDWADNPGWPGLAEARAVAAASVCDRADLAAVGAYIDACRALIVAVGAPTRATAGGPVPVSPKPYASLPTPWADADPDAFPLPYRVLAIRWLAHAAALRTNELLAASSPASTAEVAYARDCHEACLEWAHRYARADPYDWGAARIAQEICAFDYPLLQPDLFSPWVEVSDGGSGTDRAWRVSAPRIPTWFGHAHGDDGFAGAIPDNHAQIAASWGDPAHFTLNDRFAACERCRQVVFWAVDWQAYEDFETAPSALYDARLAALDSRGRYVSYQDDAWGPERQLVWLDAARTDVGVETAPVNTIGDLHQKGDVAVGNFGADRNGDGSLTRGPLPATVRLRAVPVARFAYYDKRILAALKF